LVVVLLKDAKIGVSELKPHWNGQFMVKSVVTRPLAAAPVP